MKQNTFPEVLWIHVDYRAQRPFTAVIYSCIIQLCPNYITLKLIYTLFSIMSFFWGGAQDQRGAQQVWMIRRPVLHVLCTRPAV